MDSAIPASIQQQMSSTELSIETQDQFDKVFAEWKTARKTLLEKKILYYILKNKILQRKTIAIQSNNRPDITSLIYDAMVVSKCASLNKFTGLNMAHSLNFQPKQDGLIKASALVITGVSTTLKLNCEHVYKSFSHDHMENNPESLKAAKVLQLGNKVKEEVKLLESQQYLLSNLIRKKQDLLNNSSALLKDNSTLLKLIMKKYLIKLKPEKDIIACKSLVARTESLLLKIETNIVSTTQENYTADKIQACKTAHDGLTTDFLDKKTQIEDVECQLLKYQALGDEYQQIVREYSNLQSTIDNKEMVLNSLGNETEPRE